MGIRYELPKQLVGARGLEVAAKLVGQHDQVRSVRYRAYALTPTASVDDLLERYSRELSRIERSPKPDNRKLGPNLYRLAILDQLMLRRGGARVFRRKRIRLVLTKQTGYATRIETPVAGLHKSRW